MTANRPASVRSILAIASLWLASGPILAAAEQAAAHVNGRDGSLILAAMFIGTGLVLRRRVQAGMWASRERAFVRRTQRAERRLKRTSRHR